MLSSKRLSEKTIELNPFNQFNKWYRIHLQHDIDIPDTVTLGTSSSDGKVSLRTVLLKYYNESGFVFFTNYKSKKGLQIESNNSAALLFYWSESGQQVRIEGIVEKISPEESDTYFKTRPQESQIAAWASEQSSVIKGRLELENKYQFYKKKFLGNPVDRPPFWGGFRLTPDWFEFWQNGEFRLHDRITYTKSKDTWQIARLSP